MLRSLWFHLGRLANPALCSVVIGPDGLRCVRGTPPARWLADCGDVCAEFGLTRGRLDVVGLAGRMQLRFSPEIPPAVHQRLRNVLGVHHAMLQRLRRR